MKTPLVSVMFLVLIQAIIPSFSHAVTVHPVPFTSQAPFGDWREPYKNFCEEASIAMAAHFIWKLPLTPQIADLEMRIIQKFEELVFKRAIDNTADDVATVLRVLYGFKNISVKEVFSEKELIKEIESGKVLIVPAAGRMLKNPYFTPPGPVYHILVVKGYDKSSGAFIANDPGTRRGEDLHYGQKLLFDALHDWNGGDVMNGKKIVVVVGK